MSASTAAMAQPMDDAKAAQMDAFRKMAKYPLLRSSDMLSDVREEAVEVIVTAVEKHIADMEKCSKVLQAPLHCARHHLGTYMMRACGM